MGDETGRLRRFRQIYREERRKVRAESAPRPGGRYVTWLAVLAIVLIAAGIFASFQEDVWGNARYDSVWETPTFIVGVVFGALWLVVKAVTSQQAPPR